MTLHTLRNPHRLPLVIDHMPSGLVRASFPAIPGCEGVSTNPDPWKGRDEAILRCAKAIVSKLEAEQQP